eukprot:Tbor_TRINITY_DN3447_c0_g1::TRINITY_DN3447_c0_g1_i1::g.3692::m.3692
MRNKHLFVLCQHGSHGDPSQFSYIKHCIQDEFLRRVNKRVVSVRDSNYGISDHVSRTQPSIFMWDTSINSNQKSDRGTVVCGDDLINEWRPIFESWRREKIRHHVTIVESTLCKEERESIPPLELYFSCVGHSWGGVLLREVLPSILDTLQSSSSTPTSPSAYTCHPKKSSEVTPLTFMSIASPHCGVSNLNFMLRIVGRVIGKLHSTTYQDLFLDTNLITDRLLDEDHLNAFAHFNHRVLYGNIAGDCLVSFLTSTLLVEYDSSAIATLKPLSSSYNLTKPRLIPGRRVNIPDHCDNPEEGHILYPHVMAPIVINGVPGKPDDDAQNVQSCIATRIRKRVGNFIVYPLRHHIPPNAIVSDTIDGNHSNQPHMKEVHNGTIRQSHINTPVQYITEEEMKSVEEDNPSSWIPSAHEGAIGLRKYGNYAMTDVPRHVALCLMNHLFSKD